MAIPMCAGARHIYVVGSERCRCGAQLTAALSPVETRIAGLIVQGTWSSIEVRFLPSAEHGIGVVAECTRCKRAFLPALVIARSDWKQLRSSRLSAVKAQRAIATRMIEIVNGNRCDCRVALQSTQPSSSN
jgi:hypothetical protein